MYTNISLVEAKSLLENHTILPLTRVLPLNFDTSISIFLKVKAQFLLESAESGESMGRYSFIALSAKRKFVLQNESIEDWKQVKDSKTLQCVAKKELGNPLEYVQEEMQHYRSPDDRFYFLPPFWGGLIGYLGHETVGYFEHIDMLKEKEKLVDVPVGILLFPQHLFVVDHLKRQLWIIAYLDRAEMQEKELNVEQAYAIAEKELDELVEKVISPVPQVAWDYEALMRDLSSKTKTEKNVDVTKRIQELEKKLNVRYITEKEDYKKQIRHCIECIHRGDLIQIVPSRQMSIDFKEEDRLLFYLRLRNVNPSPYMYFLCFDDFTVIGSSPESMVSLDADRVMNIKPLAGTIRRGRTRVEETNLRNKLLSDKKEQAEHLMLVDLARNDLHRIAKPGTVHVPTFMDLESFSYVTHIVSRVEGKLRDEYDSFDLIRASFPAGTLSGAPKIEAMNILGRTERYARGIYGGMVLALGFDKYFDSCIIIRTTLVKDNTAYLQAGAGIVADSDEENEWRETEMKLGALLQCFAEIKR